MVWIGGSFVDSLRILSGSFLLSFLFAQVSFSYPFFCFSVFSSYYQSIILPFHSCLYPPFLSSFYPLFTFSVALSIYLLSSLYVFSLPLILSFCLSNFLLSILFLSFDPLSSCLSHTLFYLFLSFCLSLISFC